jgi:hypothetical protein
MSNKNNEYPSTEGSKEPKRGRLSTQVSRAFNALNDKIEEIETENRKLKADLQRCYTAALTSWPTIRQVTIDHHAYLFSAEDTPAQMTEVLLTHCPWLAPLKQVFDLAYVDNLRNNSKEEPKATINMENDPGDLGNS